MFASADTNCAAPGILRCGGDSGLIAGRSQPAPSRSPQPSSLGRRAQAGEEPSSPIRARKFSTSSSRLSRWTGGGARLDGAV